MATQTAHHTNLEYLLEGEAQCEGLEGGKCPCGWTGHPCTNPAEWRHIKSCGCTTLRCDPCKQQVDVHEQHGTPGFHICVKCDNISTVGTFHPI